MRHCVSVLVLLLFIAAAGCNQDSGNQTPAKMPARTTADDVQRDAGKAINTAAEYSQQSKEAFQKQLEMRLTEIDGEIEKLREKGGDLKDEAHANWTRKMAELETKRNTAREKLAEVGQSSAEAWKDVQKGAQSAWDELDRALRDAASEF